jgi:hypothetical protein
LEILSSATNRKIISLVLGSSNLRKNGADLSESEDSTFHRLEELDGTHLAASSAGNPLKKVFARKDLLDDRRQRDEVLQEIDEPLEKEQQEFARRNANKLRVVSN